LSHGRHGTPVPTLRHNNISQHPARQVCALKSRIYFHYLYFYGHSVVTTLCERSNNHGGLRHPTAALWPNSRRHTTLRNHTEKQVKVVNVNVILINYPVYAIYKRIRRHLMWIKRLCAKFGERGRHTFVFLFRPLARAAATAESRYLVILREGNAADHPLSGSDRVVLPTLERVTLPARTGLGTTWFSDKKDFKTTYFPTLSPLPSSHLRST
jgi:hypothetical protein